MLLSLHSALLLTLASAQPPIRVSYMSYATVDEKTFYIQGGSDGTSFNGTYSLDLTELTWLTSKPPWKTLSQGPDDFGHSMTVSSDKQSLIVWGRLTGISIYNIASNTWKTRTALHVPPISRDFGRRSIADPNSGKIYIPAANESQVMLSYDPATGVSSRLSMPPELSVNPGNTFQSFGAAWSTQRNSILVYGGYIDGAVFQGINKLYEYKPETDKWGILVSETLM